MPGSSEESYALLGISSTSSPHDVLKAYSSRKSQLEAQMRSTGLSFDEKNEIFKEINQIRKAYQTLLALPEAADGASSQRGVSEDGAGQSCAGFSGQKTEQVEGTARLAAIHDIKELAMQDEGDPVCSGESGMQEERLSADRTAGRKAGESQMGKAQLRDGAADRPGCCWWFCQ